MQRIAKSFCNNIVMLIILIGPVLGYFSIDQFGAVPNNDTIEAQFINSRAFEKAVLAANSSLENDRIAVIPPYTYYFMPVQSKNLKNVTIQVQGRMIASKNVSRWPTYSGSSKYKNFFQIDSGQGIIIEGGGKIDGRGYHWWILTLLGGLNKHLKNQNDRPHLMQITNVKNLVIRDLRLKNSPQYHININDCNNVTIHSLDIRVNVTAQINLLKYFSLEGVVPMYAFNTDGIDPTGSDYHIYNLTVQNYDDVVVPKPSNRGHQMSACTQNFMVENITVILGVGMSIGSISPSTNHNCIRNITFQNIDFRRPFKGIYIKTNPGNVGDGEVTDIVYRNIIMDRPYWWAVYIGPQQMKEPDKDGPGCLLYPYDPHHTCHTQPLITISRVSLLNVTIKNSLLYPITIRCDPTNPCSDFIFQDVHADKWHVGQKKTGMVCQNVRGSQVNTSPKIYCLQQQSNGFNSQSGQQEIRQVFYSWADLENVVRQTVRIDEQPDQAEDLAEIIRQYSS